MVQENIIEFRGTKNGILIYIRPKYDFEIVKQQLANKIDKTKYFLRVLKFLIYVVIP